MRLDLTAESLIRAVMKHRVNVGIRDVHVGISADRNGYRAARTVVAIAPDQTAPVRQVYCDNIRAPLVTNEEPRSENGHALRVAHRGLAKAARPVEP